MTEPASSILPPVVPLFEKRVTSTLSKCTDTFRSRGDQYGDTWRHCQHLALRAVLFQVFGLKPTPAQCRAMASAVLVDVKYQRLEGGYTPDHLIDGINYQAYLHDEMEQVYKDSANEPSPTPLPNWAPRNAWD